MKGLILLLSVIAVIMFIVNANTKIKANVERKENEEILDVIIIGAGASGISAASELNKYNLKTKILEARNRKGGRVSTDYTSFGYPLDLGAILITQQADSPILRLIREYKLRQVPMDFSNVKFHSEDGTPYKSDVIWNKLGKVYLAFKAFITDSFSKLEKGSVRDALNAFKQYAVDLDDLDKMLVDYYGNFFNMSLERPLWDVKEFMLGGAKSFTGKVKMTPDGYFTIIKPVAESVNVQLNTVVKKIEQFADHVVVTDSQGKTYKAKYVVNTVPLGYLKKNLMEYVPSLNSQIQEAIDKLAFFNMNKVFVEFEEKFWDDSVDFLNFVYPHPVVFDMSANLSKVNGKNLLMFFITHDMFEVIRHKTDDEVKEMILKLLRPNYPGKNLKITNFLRTNWLEDPYTFGSFSEVAGHKYLRKRFQVPDGRLIFAGEHTSSDWNAFVYGAYVSGRRAAEQLLDFLKIPRNKKIRKIKK